MGLFKKKEIDVEIIDREFDVTVHVYDIEVVYIDGSSETFDEVWVEDTDIGYTIHEPIATVEDTDKPHIDRQHLREIIEEEGEAFDYIADTGYKMNIQLQVPRHSVWKINHLDKYGVDQTIDYQGRRWFFEE